MIGYLHTGFEKNMEQKTYWKGVTYAPRMDYLAFQANEYAYVAAVEKLLGIEVPAKATWMRTLLLELNRIHSHLIWLGTGALEIGAIGLLWYCFNARDDVLDLFELVGGTRMHTRYFQAGGLAEDIPRGFFTECRRFCDEFPKTIDMYETLLTNQKIWLERTSGLGLLSADDAIALGQSGPVLRASGVDWDLRRDEPYLAYPELDFDVPVYEHGDVYDRYRVRVDEMRESVKIIEQCLEGMPGGAWIADDRKVVLPPRHELHTSMESLIHHFKIVTEGYRVPEGEVYVADRVGARRVRLLPRLRRRAEAVARQVPRAVVRRARGDRDLRGRRAGRRHDRDRRLARHRDGRGRPMSRRLDGGSHRRRLDGAGNERRRGLRPRGSGERAEVPALPGAGAAALVPAGPRDLATQVEAIAHRYPDRQSLTLPALRFAQEEHGWLPPEALREVAEVLDLTPAYCQAVASFYDMFHLQPVGRHMVEICTNLSCALVGAQRVVEAFEEALGCAPARRPRTAR